MSASEIMGRIQISYMSNWIHMWIGQGETVGASCRITLLAARVALQL